MGIDLLDMKYRLEKEFEIELDNESLAMLLENSHTESPSITKPDIQVSALIGLVERALIKQNAGIPSDLQDRARAQIATALQLPLEEVHSKSWIIAELGAE